MSESQFPKEPRPSGPRWYCVEAQPFSSLTEHYYRRVAFARTNIEQLGIETFVPTETIRRKYYGVERQILSPLFGPYIFAYFDVENDIWSPICHTPGVKKLLSTYDLERELIVPTAIPNGMVENLMECTSFEPELNERVIRPGCQVRVTSGPFANIAGHQSVGICTWARNRRIALLLDIMQGRVEVQFDISAVERIEE